MSYYVNFGGINIHGVTNVSQSSGRDITNYDGLGSGNFGIPDDENLREWTISCELSNTNDKKFKNWKKADKIFNQFEILLKTKDYSRFVMTSKRNASVSELVHLKQYTKKEKYNGVFDVEITLQEYKPVTIKTTDVPYVTRPGKIPVPKMVTISTKSSNSGGSNTVYQLLGKMAPGYGNQNVQLPKVFSEFKTGKPVTNPNTVPNTPITIGKLTVPYKAVELPNESMVYKSTYVGKNAFDGITESVESTFKSISKGISDYLKKWW